MRKFACAVILFAVMLRLALPVSALGWADAYSYHFHFHLVLGGTEQERAQALASHRHGPGEPCSPAPAARGDAPAPGAVRVLSIAPAAGGGATILNISGIVAAGPDQVSPHIGPAGAGREPGVAAAVRPLRVLAVPEPPPRAA